MAVGLSARLLYALQPIQVLVRYHVSGGIPRKARAEIRTAPLVLSGALA